MKIELLTNERLDEAMIVAKEIHNSSIWNTIPYNDEFARKYAAGLINKPQYGFIQICIEDDKIIGGVCATINQYPFSLETFMDLYILFLKKEYRNRKYAVAMMKAYIEEARKYPVREIRTGVNSPGNFEKVERLYSWVGFKKTGSAWSIDV